MEDYSLTRAHIDGLSNSYILESDSIDRLLLAPGRMLLGYERQQVAFEATVTWLESMRAGGHFPDSAADLCTVTVLAEGIGHNLPGALSAVLKNTPHRGDNWIGASRFATSDQSAGYTDFEAKVNYLRLHSVAPVWCVLDTIATGATLVRVLDAAFANAQKPRKILMATPAGSSVGMRKIEALCQREDVELTSTFFGAAFGLWDDGTGLPWCHPQTILSGTERSAANRAKAGLLYNELPGFCAVGDCSANFFDVAHALNVLEEEQERFNWRIKFPQTA